MKGEYNLIYMVVAARYLWFSPTSSRFQFRTSDRSDFSLRWSIGRPAKTSFQLRRPLDRVTAETLRSDVFKLERSPQKRFAAFFFLSRYSTMKTSTRVDRRELLTGSAHDRVTPSRTFYPSNDITVHMRKPLFAFSSTHTAHHETRITHIKYKKVCVSRNGLALEKKKKFSQCFLISNPKKKKIWYDHK